MSDHIDKEDARHAAFRRMDTMFPTNRGLRPVFLMMANAHRYAIDYIAQAPVIVVAATRGVTHPLFTERAFLQEQLASLCESGAQLRDVMAAFGLPLPLRRLDARVLTSARATVIRRLALMNPSTLAQIIPTTRQKQNGWLQALEKWCVSMAHRVEGNTRKCLFFEWAAINYPGITFGEANQASHMVDFVVAHADTFNPRWTLSRARAEEQEWHAKLEEIEMVERTGVALDTVIDFTPLPSLWEHGSLSFVAMQTGRVLHAEGAAMHHCVASYWQSVINGRSRIYSILEDGNRVATLELSNQLNDYRWGTGLYRVRQLVGPRNSYPAPKVAKAVATFVEEINNRLTSENNGRLVGAFPAKEQEGISAVGAARGRG
jgi:hypothetical protein